MSHLHGAPPMFPTFKEKGAFPSGEGVAAKQPVSLLVSKVA